jgi:GT2 family glycosyltransferase
VVGAKLLDAKGAIQHAGVVLGLGGICGHIYRGARADEEGYLGELQAPREVTAVTGACIAVAREKFDAVGGFDADNLPVELNDIDLCLRIGERGWTNVWTPHAVLRHLEAASRGADPRSSITYQRERRYFVDRWSHRICDDAYFHPALSLYSLNPALA